MTAPTLLRATLAAVAVSDVLTGLTALLTPRAFYDDFPFGLGWVAELPPFNEHLTTDVGAFYLARRRQPTTSISTGSRLEPVAMLGRDRERVDARLRGSTSRTPSCTSS